ncbi:MAG: hypothetical protein ACK4S3_04390 [Parvibaculum sp.]
MTRPAGARFEMRRGFLRGDERPGGGLLAGGPFCFCLFHVGQDALAPDHGDEVTVREKADAVDAPGDTAHFLAGNHDVRFFP